MYSYILLRKAHTLHLQFSQALTVWGTPPVGSFITLVGARSSRVLTHLSAGPLERGICLSELSFGRPLPITKLLSPLRALVRRRGTE